MLISCLTYRNRQPHPYLVMSLSEAGAGGKRQRISRIVWAHFQLYIYLFPLLCHYFLISLCFPYFLVPWLIWELAKKSLRIAFFFLLFSLINLQLHVKYFMVSLIPCGILVQCKTHSQPFCICTCNSHYSYIFLVEN